MDAKIIFIGNYKGGVGKTTSHFFGEKPQLIGIFYNLLRGQVNYDKAESDFVAEINENEKIYEKIQI